MKSKHPKFETVNNLSLLDSNLHHIDFELSRSRPSFFRAARESHLALLRSMVEALRGTANLAIVGRRTKDRRTQYQSGNEPWQEIHRIAVAGCKKAWRFSPPRPCTPPKVAPTESQQSVADKELLIGFYDLLAMIQTDCFMTHLHGAQPAKISDEQLREIEGLHENVRNKFEHYIPKSYSVGIPSLVSAVYLSLRITNWLLHDSRTVISFYIPRGTRTRLSRLINRLRRLT